MNLPKHYQNQKGAIPVLILVAVLGLILFIAGSSILNFKDQLFRTLFPKPLSHAASEIAFVDNSGNPLSFTLSPSVKVQLKSPSWISDAGGSFSLVKDISAQELTPLIVESENMIQINGQVQPFSDATASIGKAVTLLSQDSSISTTLSNTQTINQITVVAKGDQCRGSPNVKVLVDNAQVLLAKVPASSTWANYTSSGLNIASGTHTISAVYDNDYLWKIGNGSIKCDRNLKIDNLTFSATTTPTPVVSSSPLVSSTPVFSPTPTPSPVAITTTSVILADNPTFQNPVSLPFSINPLVANFTFSGSFGVKTLYAKFTSSTGSHQTLTQTINYLANSKIYDEVLNNGWQDTSYTSSNNLADTSNPHIGAKDISWTSIGAYAGLQFHHSTGVSTTGFDSLTFSLKASQLGQRIAIYTSDGTTRSSLVPLTSYGGDPEPGVYKTYTLPLSAFGAVNKTIHDVVIHYAYTATALPPMYVDDVAFVNTGAAIGTPLPTSLTSIAPVSTPEPSGTQTDAQKWGVYTNGREHRPGNVKYNQTRGIGILRPWGTVLDLNDPADSISLKIANMRGYSSSQYWTTASVIPKAYYDKIDGDFVGTTEEILRWAAKKWGFADIPSVLGGPAVNVPDAALAQAILESNWNPLQVGDFESAIGLYSSYGILQARDPWWSGAARLGKASQISTALGADYAYAGIRAHYDGATWLGVGTKGNMDWAIAAWQSGEGRGRAQGSTVDNSSTYMANWKKELAAKRWLQANF